MVVVSSNWVKNVAPYAPSASSTEASYDESSEPDLDVDNIPKAILICRPNSHNFQVRTLSLDLPVKVGRSVAKAKPASNNAIFDCKVLSRNHALLWYKDGKFYLQDTKSSNGTFVNTTKLGDQSYELSSGDVVQFGVDVVENNKKVTHGCIIASIKLYLPELYYQGQEAVASPSVSQGDTRHGTIPLDDLYKLNQIIQEANLREQCLETKLNALQNIVDETKKSAEESWQAYVGEERLLSRLSALESQLQQASKNWTEDRLKDEIAKLRETNDQYQEAAKCALERVHAEKLEAVNLAIEQERCKISAQQDALLASEQLVTAQQEIQELAQKLKELQNEYESAKLENAKQSQDLRQQIVEEQLKGCDFKAKFDHLFSQLNFFSDYQQNKFKEQKDIDLLVASANEDCEKVEVEQEFETAKDEEKEEGKRVSFILPDKETMSPYLEDESENIDTKTLKNQYQSAQKEQHQLRLKIEHLEQASIQNTNKIQQLEMSLSQEKVVSAETVLRNEKLCQEVALIDGMWKDSQQENQQLKDRINSLLSQLAANQETLAKSKEHRKVGDVIENSDEKESAQSNSRLENEFLELKGKFAELTMDREKLAKDLAEMTLHYNKMIDRFQNKFFFYIAPILFIVIYLFINACFS